MKASRIGEGPVMTDFDDDNDVEYDALINSDDNWPDVPLIFDILDRPPTRGGEPRKTPIRWTLVQHSGHQHDAGFAQAVEECAVTTLVAAMRVRRAGGVLFASYDEASDAEYAANYPPDMQALHPRARGTFSRTVVDGRRIYIPATVESFKEPND
jgi:hypothetical protein